MQALSSYNPETHPAVSSALKSVEDPSRGFSATSYFSQQGVFARFVWPDWPESLKEKLAAEVNAFHQEHPELRPASDGSPAWQAVFRDWRTDPESVVVIAQAFSKHFPGRVEWVESERDSRGRIGASCMVQNLLGVPPLHPDSVMSRIFHESAARMVETRACSLQLSWKDCAAVPPGPLSSEDQAAFQASTQEVFSWAGSRIRPILDTLHDKLQALYGVRFRGLYVFGSYARPDAGIELPVDSDLDVALILSNIENRYDELERIGDITYDLSLEHGLSVSVTPIIESDFREGSSNFTRAISSYAIPVG